jgi:hypothetical protein
MRILGGLGLALLLLSGCGDLGSRAEARIASQVCDEICGWPDECFTQLGVPMQGGDCVQACEAQVEVVGIACVSAIASTVECLGTCDVESLTVDQQLACRDEAEAISSACE